MFTVFVVSDLTPDILLQLYGQINRYMNTEEFLIAVENISAGKQKRELDALCNAMKPFFTSFQNEISPLVIWTRLSENTYKLII